MIVTFLIRNSAHFCLPLQEYPAACSGNASLRALKRFLRVFGISRVSLMASYQQSGRKGSQGMECDAYKSFGMNQDGSGICPEFKP